MDVRFDKSGVPKVTFRKAETETLIKAARLLQTLGRCAEDDDATTASAVVTDLIDRYVEVQKELPLDAVPN